MGGNTFRSLTAAMDPPAINSIPTMDDGDSDTKTTDANKGFRFMGQRFTIDEAIFQQLVYDNVQADASGNQRMLPDTLDVAAALGSDTAYYPGTAGRHRLCRIYRKYGDPSDQYFPGFRYLVDIQSLFQLAPYADASS